jgi:hypothetical protein
LRRTAACALLAVAGCSVAPVSDDQVFACDPARVHPGDGGATVYDDCGEGFSCYNATLSVGFAFCLRSCRADGSCPSGYSCSGAGGCLKDCDPNLQDQGCPMPLRCIATQLGPNGTAAARGECLPVPGTCTKDGDCTSTVLNYCLAPHLFEHGVELAANARSYCLQGACKADDTACQPGASCLLDKLPPSIQADDLCVPDCTSLGECPPDMICMGDAFPASDERICIPGFYGFRCASDLSCYSEGASCRTALGPFDPGGATVCALPCTADSDCAGLMPANSQTEDAYSTNSCRYGGCTAIGNVGAVLFCVNAGGSCAGGLGQCRDIDLPAEATPDGGVSTCGQIGTANRPPPYCNPPTAAAAPAGSNDLCETDQDCAALAAVAQVPLVCLDRDAAGGLAFQITHNAAALPSFAFPGGPPSDLPQKLCVVPIPGTPCTQDDCLPGLTCHRPFPVNGWSGGICTVECTADADCRGAKGGLDLGRGFYCGPQGLCMPKIPSLAGPVPGPIDARQCLSGIVVQRGAAGDGGAPLYQCVSAPGTVCAMDGECQSGVCMHVPSCAPTGTCQ